jgi:hypothetical protein
VPGNNLYRREHIWIKLLSSLAPLMLLAVADFMYQTCCNKAKFHKIDINSCAALTLSC